MLIKQKAYIISIKKAISLAIAIAFLVNDLAFAIPGKLYQDNSTLAVPSRLTDEAFRERFLAGQFILTDAQVNLYIKEQILREQDILKNRWNDERTLDLDVSNYIAEKITSGNERIRNNVAGLSGIKLVKVTGLMARTGQFAHVGLTGRDYDGTPVMYVDSSFCNWGDDALRKHETEEILQWEDLRVNILKIIDKQSMRAWIIKNTDDLSADARVKLSGTVFEACNSVRDIARIIHSRSHSIEKLYAYKKKQIGEIGALSAAFDLEKISGLFNYHSDDPDEEKKLNIAASATKYVPPGSSATLIRYMAGYRMKDGDFILDPAAQIMDEEHPAKVTDLANAVDGSGNKDMVYRRLKLLKQNGVNLVMGGWEKGYYLPKWVTSGNIEDVIARCPGLKKSSHTQKDIVAMGEQIAAYKSRFGYEGSVSQAVESYERNTIKHRLFRMNDQDALRGLTVVKAAEKLSVNFVNLYKYLSTDPDAAAKYGIVLQRQYNWVTKEEAVGNVLDALGRFRPDIVRFYKHRNKLTEFGLKKLRRDIYDISQAHFSIWGLSSAITDTDFFGHSHINTLMAVFPDVGLDPLGFQLRWRTPEERIASIRYVISKEMPDLIRLYDSLDSNNLDPAQLKNVQDGFYSIGSYNFLEWGVVWPFARSAAPEFEGSYITTLCKVFPKASLNPLGFGLDWSTREKATSSLEFVFSEKAPSIMDRYRGIGKLSEEELMRLRADILGIDAGHFIAWGIGKAITAKKPKHFNGKYSDALVAVFSDPRLSLDRESFKRSRRENVERQYDWKNSTPENGIANVRGAISKNRPDIIDRYDRLEELGEEGVELLKKDVCEISHGLFMVWGIGKAVAQKYFSYNYKDALIAAFPKLSLDRLDFGLEWTDTKRRLESARYMLVKRLRERRPDLITKYLAKEALDPEAEEDLRSEIYSIKNGSFRTLGLSAALTRKIAPEFGGSYINVIIKSFPDLGLDTLGFQLDWSTLDRANASIRYVILREVPVIRQLYKNIETLDDSELDRLRREIARITFAHFSVWGLAWPMHKKKNNYYDTSYVTALIKAFNHPRLGLTASAFIDRIPRLQSEVAGHATKIPDYLVAEYLPIMEGVSKKYSKHTNSDPRSYLSGAYEGFCEVYVKYTPSHPRFRSLAIRGMTFGVKKQMEVESSLSWNDKKELRKIEAAEMELLENGISRPSVEDIAEVTGLKKAIVERLYGIKGTISMQTPYERDGAEKGAESTIEGSIGQIDSNREAMERDDMIGAISREMKAAIIKKWPHDTNKYLEIYRRIALPTISMGLPDTFDFVSKLLHCSTQNVHHLYATRMIPLLRRVLNKLGITKEDLLKGETEYTGNRRSKERYSMDHPDDTESISRRRAMKNEEKDDPETWETPAESGVSQDKAYAESEDDLPTGRPLGMNRAWDWIIGNFNLGPFASRTLAFNAGALEELRYSFFIVSGGALFLEKICGVPFALSVAICSLISYHVFRHDHAALVRYFDGTEIVKRRTSEEDSQELSNLNLTLRVIYGAMLVCDGYGGIFPLISVGAFHAVYNLLRTFFPGALGMSAGPMIEEIETPARNKPGPSPDAFKKKQLSGNGALSAASGETVAAPSERLPDLYISALQETGDNNIAMDRVMTALFSAGYDHFAVSHVWSILRNRYPEGIVPSDDAEARKLSNLVDLEISEYLAGERIFAGAMRLTLSGRSATVSELSEAALLPETKALDIAIKLAARGRMTVRGGVITMADDEVLRALAEREADMLYPENSALHEGSMLESLKEGFRLGVYKSHEKPFNPLTVRELYESRTKESCRGPKTYFGRDEGGLTYSVERALLDKKRNDPSEELSILLAGISTGQQAYDVAALIVERLEIYDYKGRITIVGTDLVQGYVDAAAKRSYSDYDLSGRSVENSDGYAEDTLYRLQHIRDYGEYPGRAGRILSPEEMARRWNIRFRWQVLDVLDTAAFKDIGSRMKFDLVVGSNVHFERELVNNGIREDAQARYYSNVELILKDGGIFYHTYAEPLHLMSGSANFGKSFGYMDSVKGILGKEVLAGQGLLPLGPVSKSIMENKYKFAAEGLQLAGWFKARLGAEQTSDEAIDGFLMEASTPARENATMVLDFFDDYSAAFLYFLAHKDFYNQALLDRIFRRFSVSKGWGYAFLMHTALSAVRELSEPAIEESFRKIADGIRRFPPEDFDISTIWFDLSVIIRMMFQKDAGKGVSNALELLEAVRSAMQKYSPENAQSRFNDLYGRIMVDAIGRSSGADDCGKVIRFFAVLTGILREKGLITELNTELIRGKYAEPVSAPDPDKEKIFPEDLLPYIGKVKDAAAALDAKVFPDAIVHIAVHGRLLWIASHLRQISYIDSYEKARPSLVRAANQFTDTVVFLRKTIDAYRECHAQIMGMEHVMLDCAAELDSLDSAIRSLKGKLSSAAITESDAPVGRPAQLLGEMRGMYGEENAKTSLELSGKRGKADSQRTIQRELKTLRGLKLVRKIDTKYYLASWLEDLTDSQWTELTADLGLNKASPNNGDLRQTRALMARLKTGLGLAQAEPSVSKMDGSIILPDLPSEFAKKSYTFTGGIYTPDSTIVVERKVTELDRLVKEKASLVTLVNDAGKFSKLGYDDQETALSRLSGMKDISGALALNIDILIDTLSATSGLTPRKKAIRYYLDKLLNGELKTGKNLTPDNIHKLTVLFSDNPDYYHDGNPIYDYVKSSVLDGADDRSFEDMVKIVSRKPSAYRPDGLEYLPETMCFGIEIEIAALNAKRGVDSKANERLRDALTLEFLKLKDDLGLSLEWDIKKDPDDNIEVSSGKLYNNKEYWTALAVDLDVIRRSANRIAEELSISKISQGIHIHASMPGSDSVAVQRAITFIGKAYQPLWEALSLTGSLENVKFKNSAIFGDTYSEKNGTFIYYAGNKGYAHNALKHRKFNDPLYAASVQEAIEVFLNTIYAATTRPEAFTVFTAGLPLSDDMPHDIRLSVARSAIDSLSASSEAKTTLIRMLTDGGYFARSTPTSKDYYMRTRQLYKKEGLEKIFDKYWSGDYRSENDIDAADLMREAINNITDEDKLVTALNSIFRTFSDKIVKDAAVSKKISEIRELTRFGGKISYYCNDADFKGHANWINEFIKSEDNIIISCDKDHMIRIWDINTGKFLQVIEDYEGVIKRTIKLDDNRFISYGDDHTVRIWDINTGECLKVLKGYTGWIAGILKLDDNRFVTYDEDHAIRIWDINIGECLQVLKGHIDCIIGALKLDDNRFVTYGEDYRIRIWDINTGSCLQVLKGHIFSIIGALKLDDSRFATYSEDYVIRIWDINTGKCLQILEGNGSITGAVKLDDSRFATYGGDHEPLVWKKYTLEEALRVAAPDSNAPAPAVAPDIPELRHGELDGHDMAYDMGLVDRAPAPKKDNQWKGPLPRTDEIMGLIAKASELLDVAAKAPADQKQSTVKAAVKFLFVAHDRYEAGVEIDDDDVLGCGPDLALALIHSFTLTESDVVRLRLLEFYKTKKDLVGRLAAGALLLMRGERLKAAEYLKDDGMLKPISMMLKNEEEYPFATDPAAAYSKILADMKAGALIDLDSIVVPEGDLTPIEARRAYLTDETVMSGFWQRMSNAARFSMLKELTQRISWGFHEAQFKRNDPPLSPQNLRKAMLADGIGRKIKIVKNDKKEISAAELASGWLDQVLDSDLSGLEPVGGMAEITSAMKEVRSAADEVDIILARRKLNRLIIEKRYPDLCPVHWDEMDLRNITVVDMDRRVFWSPAAGKFKSISGMAGAYRDYFEKVTKRNIIPSEVYASMLKRFGVELKSSEEIMTFKEAKAVFCDKGTSKLWMDKFWQRIPVEFIAAVGPEMLEKVNEARREKGLKEKGFRDISTSDFGLVTIDLGGPIRRNITGLYDYLSRRFEEDFPGIRIDSDDVMMAFHEIVEPSDGNDHPEARKMAAEIRATAVAPAVAVREASELRHAELDGHDMPYDMGLVDRAPATVERMSTPGVDMVAREEPLTGIVSTVELMDNVLLPALDEGRAYEVRYDKNRLRSSGDGALEAFDKYIECVRSRVRNGDPELIVKVIDRPGTLFSVASYADAAKSKKIGEARVDMPGELKDVPVDIVVMLNVAFEASGIPQGSDINSYSRLADFIKATGAQLVAGPVWNIILPRSVPVTGNIREYYELVTKQLKQYA